MDDQTVNIGQVGRRELTARPGDYQKLAEADTETDPPGDAAAGLASLSFIIAAIRRRTRFLCTAAAVGLLLGVGLYLAKPPPYQATSEVLLTLGPNEDLLTAIQTDVALAESRAVADLALHKLGLRESVSSLIASYTVTPVTNRVLGIDVSAPSSSEAVRRASGLTSAFLQFRASQLRAYEQLMSGSLNQQLAQTKARIASITSQVQSLSGHATSPAQIAKLNGLQSQLKQAKSTLSLLEQTARTTEQSTQAATNTAVRSSYVINAAAPVVHSRVKTGIVYALTALIAGLAVGLGFVVVQALISSRLRQRDDVAHALGAPVRLSVGRVRLHRVLPGHRGLAAASMPDIQRIVGHLRAALPGDRKGVALAVVPADQADVAALAVAALALSCAKQDKRVMVADLCQGAPAARLLGVRDPGVHKLKVQDTDLVVAVPERGDAVPVGPLPSAAASAPLGSPAEDLAAAYSGADVLLTLADLDPMLGAEHLPTWAADIAVMVTAGRSSWMRLQAVGEMIRLVGARMVSAVLVGADRADESLGAMHEPRARRQVDAVMNGSHSDADVFVTVDADPGTEPRDTG